MKKILLYTLAFAVIFNFSACKNEEDDIFDDSAANRITKAINQYKERFASSPGGWTMEYYPTNGLEYPTGSGYLLLADIKKDGTVRFAINNDATGYEYYEDTSLWEMIRDTGPVISFSTYNEVLHMFSDPAIYDTGNGLEGDYEFVVIDLPEDGNTAMIKGKKRGVYVRMTKLPAGTDYRAYLEDVNEKQAELFSATAPNKLLMTLGEDSMYVEQMSTMIPNIYPVSGDAIANESYHPCILLNVDGKYVLRFRAEVEIDGVETTEQEFIWNPELRMFVGVNDETCTLQGENPVDFFKKALEGGSRAWQWDMKSNMSAPVSAILDNINNQFIAVNKNYSLSYIQLKFKSGQCQMVLGYKTSKTATTKVAYNFDYSSNADGVALSYTGPETTAGENILKRVTAIQDMINVLNGSLTVKASDAPLDYTNLKLIPSAKADDWFDVTYK
ncbi:MAG: DUF4302 domain-containing protein [Prevotella sp.]|nr:DUF4302 domain-containing protein [Candidatus Equicola faecalis]